jgi:arylsulfatase A-like enzyme
MKHFEGKLMALALRFWAALIFLVLVCAAPLLASAAASEKPNIVLIYADDLGYGDVSCYGAKRVQTPNIDRLAREGLRFRDAHCSSSTCTPSRYVKKATEFIERNKSRPFFLYFATHDIHVPRVPHARFAGQNAMGARGDVILELDWCVGELLAVLERNGLGTNTLVIFTSDNGPVVDDGYQDGAKQKLGDHRPGGPLRGGKYSIFEGGSRIPCIVRWPGQVAPGLSDALISQVDFVASFAALAGQSFDPQTAPDSQNVLPALLGQTQQGRATLVEHSGGIALRQGGWKFIPIRSGPDRQPLTDTDTGNSPRVQLYDLTSDLGETNNLAEANPEKARELENLLEAERTKRSR